MKKNMKMKKGGKEGGLSLSLSPVSLYCLRTRGLRARGRRGCRSLYISEKNVFFSRNRFFSNEERTYFFEKIDRNSKEQAPLRLAALGARKRQARVYRRSKMSFLRSLIRKKITITLKTIITAREEW